MRARTACDPPMLYAWDVDGGAAGVTDDLKAAIHHVDFALRGAAPGTRGKIRKVAVSMYGSGEYLDLSVVSQARRDDVGRVVWTI